MIACLFPRTDAGRSSSCFTVNPVQVLTEAGRLVLSAAKVGKSNIHRIGAQLMPQGLQVSGSLLFFNMSMCSGSQWLTSHMKCSIAHF